MCSTSMLSMLSPSINGILVGVAVTSERGDEIVDDLDDLDEVCELLSKFLSGGELLRVEGREAVGAGMSPPVLLVGDERPKSVPRRDRPVGVEGTWAWGTFPLATERMD
jgi:hypothetical protein